MVFILSEFVLLVFSIMRLVFDGLHFLRGRLHLRQPLRLLVYLRLLSFSVCFRDFFNFSCGLFLCKNGFFCVCCVIVFIVLVLFLKISCWVGLFLLFFVISG